LPGSVTCRHLVHVVGLRWLDGLVVGAGAVVVDVGCGGWVVGAGGVEDAVVVAARVVVRLVVGGGLDQLVVQV